MFWIVLYFNSNCIEYRQQRQEGKKKKTISTPVHVSFESSLTNGLWCYPAVFGYEISNQKR